MPVGEWSAVCDGVIYRGPDDLGPGLAEAFGSLPDEALLCVPIDDDRTALGCVVVARGDGNMVSATSKDTLWASGAHGAMALVVAHNHPFGHTTPSPPDLAFTRRLLEAAELVGMEVLDHLVVGARSWRSLRETTDLWDVGTGSHKLGRGGPR